MWRYILFLVALPYLVLTSWSLALQIAEIPDLFQANSAILARALTHCALQDDEVRFRAFDAAFRIAALSETMLQVRWWRAPCLCCWSHSPCLCVCVWQWVRDTDLLGLVVDTLATDDVLLHMVVVELLVPVRCLCVFLRV